MAGDQGDDQLDGCAVDMAVADQLTEDGEQVDALVLFADVDFTDPEAVRHRMAEWQELANDAS